MTRRNRILAAAAAIFIILFVARFAHELSSDGVDSPVRPVFPAGGIYLPGLGVRDGRGKNYGLRQRQSGRGGAAAGEQFVEPEI